MNFTWKPLTMDTWRDFKTLFGPNGACAGCWCMWWRIPRSEFNANKNSGNHAAMKDLVESGVVPGLLGYVDGRTAGWVSVAPRDDYPALNRSKVLGRKDETPVWSIVCFFTLKTQRRGGMMTRMIQVAAEYARSKGARVLEAYLHDPAEGKRFTTLSAFIGVASVFKRLGFQEVSRRSVSRPIMRLNLT